MPALTDIEQSSPMPRKRALTEALFGVEDLGASASAPPQISIMPDMDPDSDDDRPTQPTLSPIKPLQTPKRSNPLRHPKQAMSSTSPSVATMPMSPGGLLSPLSPTPNMKPAELALEVQRRAEAATAALRKRISPNKISALMLVSASTSVDAIPLHCATPTPASQQASSRIGSLGRGILSRMGKR